MSKGQFDFQGTWEDEMKRFQELTGKKLLASIPRSPENLQEEFNELFKNDDQETYRTSQAKKIGMDIISCVKLLGGVAALGASIVFPPAELCFKAISLLLDVPKEISDMHEEIRDVFAQIGPTLSRFRIYARIEKFDTIDEDLLQSVHEVMICFVDICALCINVQYSGRWKKLKEKTKRVLFDNKEVVDGLKRFEGLVRQQQNTQNTVALEFIMKSDRGIAELLTRAYDTGGRVKNIEANVGILTDAEKKRTSEKMTREYLSKIKAKIGISDEEQNASKTTYEDIWKSAHPRSGNWFKEIESYMNWADSSRDGSSPLLFLTGPPGSGKTFSVSAIIHHLQSKYSSTESANKCLVAYHFFPARTGKSDDDKQPVETALKSLALQLVEQDSAHAKIVSSACSDVTKDEKFFKNAKCMDLWNVLKLGSPMRKTTHFIIFDGLDYLTVKEVDRLLEMIGTLQDTLLPENDSGSVKILMCGHPKLFESGFIKLDRLLPFTIEVMGHIQGEMRMYLNHELQAAELFQGRDQKTLHQKKEIHRMLLEQPDCSFYTIQEALGDIKELVSSGGSEAELMKLLAKFSLDPISRLKEDINKLETQLKGRQVDEINELLAWVIFGKRVLTIEELDAALFLRFKRDIIERLDRYIDKNFSKILKRGSDNRVRLQDDEIADCVVKQRETPRMTDDPPRISATITITNVDRTTVQRFLWDLNTYSTLDKFSFQQGSDNSNSPKGHIQVNEVDSHLHIVKLTFEFLRGPVDSRTQPIGRYLLRYLPDHLKVLYEATGLDVIGPNDKREIGRGIYDLFDDVEIVERHWDSWGATWFRSSEQTSIFWKWLQDPVAISSLSRNDKKLLVNARSDENPDRKLFTPILTHIAHIWLQTRKGAPIVAFSWIRGFLSLGTTKNDSDSDGKDNKTSNDTNAGESAGSSRYDKDSEAVYMAEKWAETVLGPPESNSLWCERIGETFRNMGNHTKAHDYFILAAGVPDANWTAFEGSAECYYHQDDVVNACIMIKKAEEILEHQGESGKSDLIDIRMRLAGWYASLQQRDDALRCCEAAYNLDPSDTKAQCLLMRQYLKHGKKKEAQQILSKAAACDPSELRPMLEFIVEEEVDEEPYPSFFWNIIRNCESVGSLDILLQDLETAISDTKADGDYYHMSHFLLYKGLAAYHRGKIDASAARLAPSFWEQCCLVVRENLTWRWDRVRIFRRASRVLSWHHFEKLREAPESERHVVELERLVTEQYQINPGLSAAKCYLAVYYTSRKEKEKARKVFLSDMGTAFRILSDNTSINDWEGYSILADIMLYTGDEANSTAASWQLAPAVINADIIAALLKSEESITREPVVTEILRIFNSSSHQEHDPEKSIKLLIDETSKLARLAAEKDEEFLERQYLAARSLLEAHELVIQQDFQYICDGCESRRWGFENAMNPCKFCYNTGFCDRCLADLKASSSSSSSPAGQWHVCDPHHEWLRLPRWEVDRYVRACKRIVQVQCEEDGEVTAVTCAASEWLAKLRVDWGLSSEDWPDSIFVQPLSRSLGG